jgi:hypothetical protein
MRWRREREEPPPALRSAFTEVRHAVAACSTARGDDVVGARAELAAVLVESTGALAAMADSAPRRSKLPTMADLAAEELWRLAEPWLSLTFVLTNRPSMSTTEMSELQRGMWARTEALVAACADADGDDLRAARAGLRAHVVDIEASAAALDDSALSERQRLMWRYAVDEIREFAAPALAGERR